MDIDNLRAIALENDIKGRVVVEILDRLTAAESEIKTLKISLDAECQSNNQNIRERDQLHAQSELDKNEIESLSADNKALKEFIEVLEKDSWKLSELENAAKAQEPVMQSELPQCVKRVLQTYSIWVDAYRKLDVAKKEFESTGARYKPARDLIDEDEAVDEAYKQHRNAIRAMIAECSAMLQSHPEKTMPAESALDKFNIVVDPKLKDYEIKVEQVSGGDEPVGLQQLKDVGKIIDASIEFDKFKNLITYKLDEDSGLITFYVQGNQSQTWALDDTSGADEVFQDYLNIVRLGWLCRSKERPCPNKADVQAYPIQLSKSQIAILGRPNFGCMNIAKYLMEKGVYAKGPSKAEYEQAICIHYLLGMLDKHHENWIEESDKFLQSLEPLPPLKDE